MSYSFQIPRDEFRRGRWYGNVDHRSSQTRLEKLEEMRQKEAIETEGECLQNSDQTNNAMWGRNVGTTKR